MPPSLQKDVFISYSQADRETAEAICRSLEEAQLSCWIAPRNIPPGKTWAEFIPDAIAHSRAMVLVISANANDSRQVRKEVDIADNKQVPIVPFRIEDVPLSKALEYHLAGTQWLDAYTPPLSTHLERLVATIGAITRQQADADVLPIARPRRPWKLIAVAAATVALFGIAAVWWLMRPPAQHRLSYSLTVQKVVNHQKDGPEFQSTGHESSAYGNGWLYRMNVTAGQSGYLYVLNEGTVNDNVLFPTEPNRNHVSANQTMELPLPGRWYQFDDNPGVERVRIIFSIEPLSDLDTIIRSALNNPNHPRTIAITDPAQVKMLRDVVARYGNTNPVVDQGSKQSIITASGTVITSLLELNHQPQ